MRTSWVPLVGGLAATAGCQATTSSDNIRTQDMVMEAAVVSDGTGVVTVTATLRASTHHAYVLLTCDDALIARAGEEERELARAGVSCSDQGSSPVAYEASFELASDVTDFQIALERARYDDALDNAGSLPPAFDITSTYDGVVLSRASDEVQLTWEPSGSDDDMAMEVEHLGCFYLKRKQIAGDPGEYALAAGDLVSSNAQSPDTCEAELTLFRTHSGQVDGLLHEGSTLVFQQVRSVSFVSGP